MRQMLLSSSSIHKMLSPSTSTCNSLCIRAAASGERRVFSRSLLDLERKCTRAQQAGWRGGSRRLWRSEIGDRRPETTEQQSHPDAGILRARPQGECFDFATDAACRQWTKSLVFNPLKSLIKFNKQKTLLFYYTLNFKSSVFDEGLWHSLKPASEAKLS